MQISLSCLCLSVSVCLIILGNYITKVKNKVASLSVVGMRGRVFGYQNFLKWAYIEHLISMPIEITDWWKGDNVISGGADSKLCISFGISVL